MDSSYLGFVSGAVFTALSIILSGVLIWRHLTAYSNPKQQRLIIVIILMVPLFAIDSYVGMLEVQGAEWIVMILDAVKECYEAIVIWAFLQLMYSYLDLDGGKTIPKELEGRHIHQTMPFNWCMKDMELNAATLSRLTMWTTQFVVLRPIISVISVLLQLFDDYDKFSFYINIVLNVSVTLAVYALMLFYHAFADELSEHRPLAKFLCIKGVVFFAFWQGVVLEILVWMGIVHEGHWWTSLQVSYAIQNFLVCFEMGVIFATAHTYAFSHHFYTPGYVKKVDKRTPNSANGGSHDKKHK